MTSPHEHDRPDQAAMLAALDLTEAILTTDEPATRQAASGGCPACTAIAAASFGITLASTMAGDKMFTSEPVRLALLDAVQAARDELRAAGN